MLELSAGPISARIVPEAGGIISRLNWRAPDGRLHKILRAPEGAYPTTAAPNMFGCWAMLPFANRAFDNVVDDGERCFTVEDNNEDRRGNIHGFGWQAAWDVLEYDRSHTVLEHRRSSGSDPYRYRARQEVRVDFTGMTVALAILNESDSALPFGLGLHPWFNCAPDTLLALKAEGALVFGESFRATGSRSFEDGGPYAEAPVFATGQETAWSLLGWDGTARIETPSTGLAVSLSASQSLRSPVVWAPAGADFLCVEPQSHAIGAPSEEAVRAVTPLQRLKPGETLSGWMRIAPQKI
jgi:aldose 1-epimerase